MTDKKALDAAIAMLRERAPDLDWDLFAKVMAETPQSGDPAERAKVLAGLRAKFGDLVDLVPDAPPPSLRP